MRQMRRRPHILIASRIFEPEPAAAALRLAGLSRALGEAGARISVLTTSFGKHRGTERRASASVKRWPALRDRTGAVRGYISYLSFDIPLALRLATAPSPDVVVCEPPPTTGCVTRVVCAVRRIPYVYYAGDIVSDAAVLAGIHPMVVKVVRAMERFALSGARRVIAVGPEVAGRARELGARDCQVVPNGIDTSSPLLPRTIPAFLARRGIEPGPGPHLVYAGTVAPWLGPELFLSAFRQVVAELPEAELFFVGQGVSWQELKNAAQDSGLAVHVLESVSADEARQLNAWADVALASLRPGGYDYAYPTKILAALAQGTPVVYAGRGPAADDVSSHDLGTLADFTVDAVAAAMIKQATAAPDRGEAERNRLRSWVSANRSLATSAATAARAVLDLVGERARRERA